jgi:hypothetical protein
MSAKKTPKAFRPSPKTAQAGQELRARANTLSNIEREALFNRGMQLIYGGVEAAQAKLGIAEGIGSMERGEGKPAETVFARLRKKRRFKAKG